MLEAKNSAKCSWHPKPDGQSATQLAPSAHYRNCHATCLKPGSARSCCWRCNPNGQPVTGVAFPAIYGHVTLCAGRGEHTTRHVLLASSADNHPATKRLPSHKTPRCHRTCLKPGSPPTPPAELASSYYPQPRKSLWQPRSLRSSVHVSAKCSRASAPYL